MSLIQLIRLERRCIKALEKEGIYRPRFSYHNGGLLIAPGDDHACKMITVILHKVKGVASVKRFTGSVSGEGSLTPKRLYALAIPTQTAHCGCRRAYDPSTD